MRSGKVSIPVVIHRVAQLLNASEIRYFQSRYRVKLREIEDTVDWHQDVGPRNGGCYPSGRPIPTLSIWMSIDGATQAAGSIQVLPGTHRQPLGEWHKGYSAKLEARGHLTHLDLAAAVALEAMPGQFYVFHSWLLHTSGPNASDRPRTAVVARFVRPRTQSTRRSSIFRVRSDRAAKSETVMAIWAITAYFNPGRFRRLRELPGFPQGLGIAAVDRGVVARWQV